MLKNKVIHLLSSMMFQKMKYEITDERWGPIRAYMNKVWKNPESVPDKGLLLSLSDDDFSEIFTKKRLEIVRIIQADSIKNVSQLSKKTGRQLSAVMRDLGILKKYGIVELVKKGNNVTPLLAKEVLIIPLVELKTKNLEGDCCSGLEK